MYTIYSVISNCFLTNVSYQLKRDMPYVEIYHVTGKKCYALYGKSFIIWTTLCIACHGTDAGCRQEICECEHDTEWSDCEEEKKQPE